MRERRTEGRAGRPRQPRSVVVLLAVVGVLVSGLAACSSPSDLTGGAGTEAVTGAGTGVGTGVGTGAGTGDGAAGGTGDGTADSTPAGAGAGPSSAGSATGNDSPSSSASSGSPSSAAASETPNGGGTSSAQPPGPHSLYVVDTATAQHLADAAYQALTPAERAGQLFMVGVPVTGPTPAQLRSLERLHVGSYFLHGRSSGGVDQTARLVARLQPVAGSAGDGGAVMVAPFVSADQEGGQVQTLRGPGFSTIPEALAQGQLADSTLRSRAARWGGQLAAAGVNLNLAPVADTVPASLGRRNEPIGRYDREYGHEPGQIADSVAAFVRGMTTAGVGTSAKHFPGLGRVIGNTDTTAGVTDDETVRGDEALQPFAAAIRAGSPMVMMSSAIYSRIDPGTVAAFSPVIIGQVLRGDLGFDGVVVSDDLGAAKAVAAVPAGERAVRFFSAGGDLLLTVSAAPADTMVAAVLQRQSSDAGFADQVQEAVRRVLLLKARMGLVRAG